VVVAIAGPPNAGKSTLLNRLARREAAIVSPYAGTTRDVIEVHLDLGGMAVTLLDTAGIRDTDDPVEMEGVRRARDRAAGADLVLWLEDASQPPAAGPMAQSADAAGAASPVIPEREPSDERNRTSEASPEPAAGSRVRAFSAPRNDSEQSPGTLAPPSPGAATTASTPGPDFQGAPPVWLVRNKIDLIQGDRDRSEDGIQPKRKDELLWQSNKPLRNIDNIELTPKSEPKDRTYRPLKGMVKGELRGKSESSINNGDKVFTLSAVSGEGFDGLLAELTGFAATFVGGAESALVTRARHRHLLEETLAALRRALAPNLAGHEDLVAEELRAAAASLGRLTGRVDVEDILDVIFRDFCIGK
jgi:tRNA U34 5-carboxymethylaminomethyl modifying GTPase MnmE/TrmE